MPSFPTPALPCHLLILALTLSRVAFAAAPRQPTTQRQAGAVFQEFQIPAPGGSPFSIVTGPDGALWFTNIFPEYIGRMTTAGVFTTYPMPLTRPTDITVGPDGHLWFTENSIGQVARLSVTGTVLSTINFASFLSSPGSITTGPDGNVWVALTNAIAKITPLGQVTEYPVQLPAGVSDIATGPDGHLWFTAGSGHYVGRMSVTGSLVVIPLPTPFAAPAGIAVGPDGNLWVTEFQADRIARITPDGTVVEYPLGSGPPASPQGPNAIVSGPDGNLWVTAFHGSSILRVSVDGRTTPFPTPSAVAGPQGLTVGPDGNIWFVEAVTDKIARLFLATTPVTLQSFTAD